MIPTESGVYIGITELIKLFLINSYENLKEE